MRESPWGPLETFDAHVHFFSHTFFERLIAQKPGLTWEDAAALLDWTLPTKSAEEFGATWLAELDHHKVQGAALMASLPGEESSVLAACNGSRGRLLPFAMVNPKEWNTAAADNIRAACLFPAMHRYSIQDPAARARV